MDVLRAKILELRCPVSGEPKHFIPLSALSALLTANLIRETMEKYIFEPWYDIDDLANKIHGGARRIFAVLALAKCNGNDVIQFLENDNLQGSPLDHRLPFSLADLRCLAPSIAVEFYEKQWEVCAPVFCKDTDHRKLDKFTSLPFIENFKLGQGGFGEIYRISVHEDHLLVDPKENMHLVRKQFPEVESTSDKSHEQELFNLCLLNQIRHPNILELVSFYTYQNRRNFVFPLAQDGDLEKLLLKEARPKEFECDFSIWKALSGLSSALETMHSYTSEKKLDLNMQISVFRGLSKTKARQRRLSREVAAITLHPSAKI